MINQIYGIEFSGKIDISHIIKEHDFVSGKVSKSKFIENIDLRSIANEAVKKPYKSSIIAESDDIYTGIKFPSNVIDVEMGRQIGWNAKKTVPRNSLRIVLNENGDIVTMIPII